MTWSNVLILSPLLALDILAPKNVDKFSDIISRESEYLIKYLTSASFANGSVSLIKPLQFFSMNVILQASLGKRVDSPHDPEFREIVRVIDQSMKFAGVAEDISSFLPILTVLDVVYRKERKLKRFIEEVRNPLFRRLIKESLDSGEECLAKWFYEYKDEEVDDHGILVALSMYHDLLYIEHVTWLTILNVGDIVAGGADTTAVSLSWFMVIMCHHPEVQERLRAEVDEFLLANKRFPTFADRDSFPYLISVQKECIRYRPTTHFGLLHQATADGK